MSTPISFTPTSHTCSSKGSRPSSCSVSPKDICSRKCYAPNCARPSGEGGASDTPGPLTPSHLDNTSRRDSSSDDYATEHSFLSNLSYTSGLPLSGASSVSWPPSSQDIKEAKRTSKSIPQTCPPPSYLYPSIPPGLGVPLDHDDIQNANPMDLSIASQGLYHQTGGQPATPHTAIGSDRRARRRNHRRLSTATSYQHSGNPDPDPFGDRFREIIDVEALTRPPSPGTPFNPPGLERSHNCFRFDPFADEPLLENPKHLELNKVLKQIRKNKYAPKTVSPLNPLRNPPPDVAWTVKNDISDLIAPSDGPGGQSPRYFMLSGQPRNRSACDTYQGVQSHCSECDRDSLCKKVLACRIAAACQERRDEYDMDHAMEDVYIQDVVCEVLECQDEDVDMEETDD